MPREFSTASSIAETSQDREPQRPRRSRAFGQTPAGSRDSAPPPLAPPPGRARAPTPSARAALRGSGSPERARSRRRHFGAISPAAPSRSRAGPEPPAGCARVRRRRAAGPGPCACGPLQAVRTSPLRASWPPSGLGGAAATPRLRGSPRPAVTQYLQSAPSQWIGAFVTLRFVGGSAPPPVCSLVSQAASTLHSRHSFIHSSIPPSPFPQLTLPVRQPPSQLPYPLVPVSGRPVSPALRTGLSLSQGPPGPPPSCPPRPRQGPSPLLTPVKV
ncbi:hypothetical protein ACRRTK_023798 [Alexandromys fortis]